MQAHHHSRWKQSCECLNITYIFHRKKARQKPQNVTLCKEEGENSPMKMMKMRSQYGDGRSDSRGDR
jgi:hypothetical protein